MARWKRNGNKLVFTVTEDELPIKAVVQWKRLLMAENDLAFTVGEYRRGADWATNEALDAARTEATLASDNWRAVCRAMGYKSANGRTLAVHVEPGCPL